MELDDTWDPDPLPNGNPRTQTQPRLKEQAVHSSRDQTQFFERKQSPRQQQPKRRTDMSLYDDASDDDSSSGGYTASLSQQQVSHKRGRNSPQAASDRHKRHQNEHPSGVGRGRNMKREGSVFNQIRVASQSRCKSLASGRTHTIGTEEMRLEGYQDFGKSLAPGRKSIFRSQSRPVESSRNQSNMGGGDYSEKPGKSNVIHSQKSDSAKRRFREESIYGSAPPQRLYNESPNQTRQESSRNHRDLKVTPQSRQHREFPREQSRAPTSLHDDGGNFYPVEMSIPPSSNIQKQRHKPQLRSPIWPDHESIIQKPSPAAWMQTATESNTRRNSIPRTNKSQSMGRSLASNGSQVRVSRQIKYDYNTIGDDEVNDIPLENDLRAKSSSHMKANDHQSEILNALPKHSVFQSRNARTTNQVYKTPSRNANKVIDSQTTIDLVTPESAHHTRGTLPFLPNNWTPHMKRPPKGASTPLKNTVRDNPSANTVQHPSEDARQVQAAEKIIRRELHAESEALQKDLFGEVVVETEEEKREHEEAVRAKAQKEREERERQLADEAEAKRKRAEVRALKEQEKKAAEQREKDKEAAAKKAKRDADRLYQSQREEQAATERRNAANKLAQEKKERDMAIQKALDEQKQAAEKISKEQDAWKEQMCRQMRQLQSEIKANNIAKLKPARKSTAEGKTSKVAEVPSPTVAPPRVTLQNTLEFDDEDSLFLPETENTTASVSTDQQMINKPQIPQSSLHDAPGIVQPVEPARHPTSMAEIFANTISNPSSHVAPEDREAEREAIQKQRAEERAAMQRKRAKSVPAEPSPKDPGRMVRAMSKGPSKDVQKKKSANPRAKTPDRGVFGIKIIPLHNPTDFLPRKQPEQTTAEIEEPRSEHPVLKPRPLLLPVPPSLPVSTKVTASKPGPRLISEAERDEIEASRAKIQAEAKARKNALEKQRVDARKDELERKRTVEYRKKREKQLRDEALRNGREVDELELESTLEKIMGKRERDKKRRNQRRAEEKNLSSDHDSFSNSNVANAFGMIRAQPTSAQVSSSDTASDFNHMEEDDDPERQVRKEHEIRTAQSLKALVQSRAIRSSQPLLPAKKSTQKSDSIFGDDETSDESEEDPDDDETLEAMLAHNRKINAAKPQAENTDEVQQDDPTEDELALERELEAALEAELMIDGESEEAATELNPDDYGTQIVAPMPDMSSCFEGSSTQQSSNTLVDQPTQPAAAKPQKPLSYKMVNVYMVMTQLTFHEHEDEPSLKKKFLDIDKANKYAQTLVNECRAKKHLLKEIVEKWDQEHRYSCQITHDNNKSTKVFVEAVPMNPKEIDEYDPLDIRPKFANQYYIVRYEKVTEKLDDETQEVCMIERTGGFVDASKLYTALEMANHAACEHFLKEMKPREELEEHLATFYEMTRQLRESRDQCNKDENLFDCEVERETCPWVDFKTFEVQVDLCTTEGPIN